MGVNVYKVPLYRIGEPILKHEWLCFVEYVCDIIVLKKSKDVIEVSCSYPLNTVPVCFTSSKNELFIYEPDWFNRNDTLCKYFVSQRSFTDSNMVSVDEAVSYFSLINSKWNSIYDNELKLSIPVEQKNINDYVKTMRGIFK